MQNTSGNLPRPVNEPILSYGPGNKERELLKAEIKRQESEQIEIPVIIGGKEVHTGKTGKCIEPHEHGKVLATYHKASEKEVADAIEASQKAKADWEKLDSQMRASIFVKAAELLRTKYRYILNAVAIPKATLVRKTPHQRKLPTLKVRTYAAARAGILPLGTPTCSLALSRSNAPRLAHAALFGTRSGLQIM